MNLAIHNSGFDGGHPDAGELLSYLDRGAAAPELGAIALHLAGCEFCQRELQQIEGDVRVVTAALASDAAGTIPVSDIRKQGARVAIREAKERRLAIARRGAVRTRLTRVAAAAALVVIGGLAAGPGYALIRDLIERMRGGTAEVVTTPATALPAPLPEVDAPRIHVEWSAPAFGLTFENVRGGTVEFRRQDGAVATIQVVGEHPNVASVSGGVVIRGSGAAGSSPYYVVTLPRGVAEVALSVGGVRRVISSPAAGDTVTLPPVRSGG